MNRNGKTKGKGKKKKASMVKRPPWLELPEGIWANILHRLGAVEILETAQKVCTTWRRICKEPSMWRVINIGDTWEPSDMPYDLEKMCVHAVDRSQGQVVDINLDSFATDELILRIAKRSGKLKRLSIAYCYGMVCDGLVKAVKKLPLLEELSLTHTDITTEGIEALGRSCPRLKLFEMNSCYTGHYLDLDDDSDEDDNSDEDDDFDEGDIRNSMALAIAKNLPALHHLELIGNWMTNEGLEAILAGCPNLISLDLRRCLKISFDEVLSSRISQQIKDVKYPHDSLTGCKLSFEPLGNAVKEYIMSSDDYYFGF